MRRLRGMFSVSLKLIWLGALLFVPFLGYAQAPVPFINLPLVPDATPPGGAGFVLTVNGTGFVPGSVVNWNGTPQATTFLTASQLRATVPAADIATKGTGSVTVVNPGPGGGISNVAFFSITGGIGHSGTFVPGSYLNTGACPGSVAAGDFNGDGNLDLAVTSYCSNTVSVLLGDGAGNFTFTSSPTTGNGPQYLAAGDFNGDGKLDLVVVNYLDGTASILLGDGAGNFTLASSPATGSWPASVVVGDFNRDGHLDLAVTLFNSDKLSILLGDGAGNFTLVSSPATSNGPQYPAVGDFNGDGNLDLALTNPEDGTVSILLGDGTGHFNFYSSAPTGSNPISVVAADFNGDGKLDLAVANQNGNNGNPNGSISILLGDGTGHFTLASSPAPGINPNPVVVGDFNADGKVDLAVSDISFGTMFYGVTTLVGDRKGNFSLTSTIPSGAGEPSSVVVGDFNGDGKLDLAVTDWENSRISILLNHGRQSPTTTTLASSANPSVFWQTVTLTAVVTSGSEKPTGSIVFWDGSAILGTATLTDGSASISLQLPAGSHTITAQFQGSVDYSAGMSTPLKQVVNHGATTTSVVSSRNPAFVNETVSYTATVDSHTGGVVTGSLSFQDGGVTIATVALSSYQQASFTASYSAGGTHQITAIYLGDSNNAGSASSALVQTIWNPNIASKTVVLTSGSPSLVGQPVTFTVMVTSNHGSIPDGELVTFFDGWTQLASVALIRGMAAYTTASLSAKTHYIKGNYSGDATFKPSGAYDKQVVLKYPTTLALTSSRNPSNHGQVVTFTATLTTSGPYALAGWVRFWDGATVIGTERLNGGVATLNKSTLAIGTHAITAKYLSDSYHAQSTSNEVDQVVQ